MANATPQPDAEAPAATIEPDPSKDLTIGTDETATGGETGGDETGGAGTATLAAQTAEETATGGLADTIALLAASTEVEAPEPTETDQGTDQLATIAGVAQGVQGPPTPTAGNDALTGTSGADVIDGLAGNDTILGLGSADTLSGSAGSDRLFGGLGADSLNGGDDSDFLEGGPQADAIFGGTDTAPDIASYVRSTAAVRIDLLNGNASGGEAQGDTLTNVNDLLGSDFADTLIGDNGNNVIEGGQGADQLVGQGGDLDMLAYVTSPAGVQVDLNSGQTSGGHAEGDLIAGFEGVTGSRFADDLRASDDGSWVDGGGGDDQLAGGTGADVVLGGAGDDDITGGGGSDSLYGGEGADQITGGSDYDFLFPGGGTDTLTGNGGPDDYIFHPLDFAPDVESADHITDYDPAANQWIRIEAGTWQVTDITVTNDTGYSFDPNTNAIIAPGGDEVVAIIDNWDGGPVFLAGWP